MSDKDLASQFEREIEVIAIDGDFDQDITKVAAQFIELWKENSPEDSGEYKDSIQVINEAEGGEIQIGATAEYANIIEYGSEDTPEFAPMRRTVEQINNLSL